MDNLQEIEHVCKNCGAQIEYQGNSKTELKCSYCGTEVSLVITPNAPDDPQKKLYEQQSVQRREAQQQHRPDHEPGYLSFKTRPYQGETPKESFISNKTLLKKEGSISDNDDDAKFQSKLQTEIAVNSFFTGLSLGFVMWFVLFIIRAFLNYAYGAKFELFSTTYNNIFISPYFGSWWWLRGLITVSVTCYLYVHNKLRGFRSQSRPQYSETSNGPTFINTFKFSMKLGLGLWFVYYIVRAFLQHSKLDLADTPYHNILVSRMGDIYWALRGGLLILLSGIFHRSVYRQKQE